MNKFNAFIEYTNINSSDILKYISYDYINVIPITFTLPYRSEQRATELLKDIGICPIFSENVI